MRGLGKATLHSSLSSSCPVLMAFEIMRIIIISNEKNGDSKKSSPMKKDLLAQEPLDTAVPPPPPCLSGPRRESPGLALRQKPWLPAFVCQVQACGSPLRPPPAVCGSLSPPTALSLPGRGLARRFRACAKHWHQGQTPWIPRPALPLPGGDLRQRT